MQKFFADDRNGPVNEVTAFRVDASQEIPERSPNADDIALLQFAQIELQQFRDRSYLFERAGKREMRQGRQRQRN